MRCAAHLDSESGLCTVEVQDEVADNTASVRVAEKAGMRYEKDILFEGYTHPDRVYVVTAS